MDLVVLDLRVLAQELVLVPGDLERGKWSEWVLHSLDLFYVLDVVCVGSDPLYNLAGQLEIPVSIPHILPYLYLSFQKQPQLGQNLQ